MSEVKTREEKVNTICSLNSPCNKDKICNLSQGSCEYPTSNLTFYIKDKGYTGDISTMIKKINQEYGHIIDTAKCNVSKIRTDIGKTFKDIKKTLKGGDLMVFYFPENNKVLCQRSKDLVNAQFKSGVAVNPRELKKLRYYPNKLIEFLTDTRKKLFMQLSHLTPKVYIKQSQIYNLTQRGFNFFVLLPTNIRWISNNDMYYKNFDVTEHKYGDILYMLVPISNKVKIGESKSNKKKIEERYCNTSSYSKYQNILLNKTKELYSAIIADEGNIKQIHKKIKMFDKQLQSEPKNKQIKIELSKLKAYSKMIKKMRELKPSAKTRYPYWYSLDNPIGRKLRDLGKLKPYEYNGYYVNPVYKGKTEFLACQSKDINYEANLYAYISTENNKPLYSQSLETLYRFGQKYTKTNYYRVPFNKRIRTKNDFIRIKTEDEFHTMLNIFVKPVPIYCVKVVTIFDTEAIIYYGTSKDAVEQFYNGILTVSMDYKKKSLLRMNFDIDQQTKFDVIKEDTMQSPVFEIKFHSIAMDDDGSLGYSSEEDNDQGNNEGNNNEFDDNIDDSLNVDELKQQLYERLGEYSDHLIRQYNVDRNAASLLRGRFNDWRDRFVYTMFPNRDAVLSAYRNYKERMEDLVRRTIIIPN